MAVPKVDGAMAIEELGALNRISPSPKSRRLRSRGHLVVVIVRVYLDWVNKSE